MTLAIETSMFRRHRATVAPGIGAGDRWSCAREIGIHWHRPVVYAFWFMCGAIVILFYIWLGG